MSSNQSAVVSYDTQPYNSEEDEKYDVPHVKKTKRYSTVYTDNVEKPSIPGKDVYCSSGGSSRPREEEASLTSVMAMMLEMIKDRETERWERENERCEMGKKRELEKREEEGEKELDRREKEH